MTFKVYNFAGYFFHKKSHRYLFEMKIQSRDNFCRTLNFYAL